MKVILLPAVSFMAAAQALCAAPARTATTTTSAPASQPVRLFNEAMIERAEAITALRNDPSFQREVRQRRREIQLRLRTESDAEARIMLALGWANWELAEAIAPVATRWLMGYRTRNDLERFGQGARWTGHAVDVARRGIESLDEPADSAVKRRRARWREMIETFRLFAAAYDALARAVPDSKARLAATQEACREAALGLAELRENEDLDTAAAARLWQAALLEAGRRSKRDLAILDLALEPPERLPYDFFSRILRCQILMDNGSYALVAALTLRMEQRCERWFGEDTMAATRAKLTLIAVRINCMWRWADALRDTAPDQTAQLQQQADALATAGFAPDRETTIYRLDRAIPIYVELPPLAEEPPVSRTAPAASRPTSAPESRPGTRPTSPETRAERAR